MLLASDAKKLKEKKNAFRLGEKPTRQEEAKAKLAARKLRSVMASLTNPRCLLSTKALNMQHKSTHKQTNRCSSNKNTRALRDAWKAKKHKEERITQRPINLWLPTRTVSRRLLSTC